jgi:hypothetical protein
LSEYDIVHETYFLWYSKAITMHCVTSSSIVHLLLPTLADLEFK